MSFISSYLKRLRPTIVFHKMSRETGLEEAWYDVFSGERAYLRKDCFLERALACFGSLPVSDFGVPELDSQSNSLLQHVVKTFPRALSGSSSIFKSSQHKSILKSLYKIKVVSLEDKAPVPATQHLNPSLL